MIAVLEKPAGSCKRILDYNYKKLEKGKAAYVDARNIEKPEEKENVMFEMLVREEAPLRSNAKHFGFHLSVNPGNEEIQTDETAKEFIHELMDMIGYGNQPYIIFKHFDIKREHYHVVASRITDHNRIIASSYEHYRVFNALEELQEKYGYVIGKDPDKLSQRMENTLHFDPDGENVKDQVENIIRMCHRYTLENMWQLHLLLLSMGLGMEKDDESNMKFYGVDKKGKRSTQILAGIRPGLKYSLLLAVKKNEKKTIEKDPETIADNIWNAAENSARFADFIKELAGIATTAIVHKDDKGNPTGMTFIDHVDGLFYDSNELGLTNVLVTKWKKELKQCPENMPCLDVLNYLKNTGQKETKHKARQITATKKH